MLGAAAIARTRTLPAMAQAPSVDLAAVASRSLAKSTALCAELGVPNAYGSYEELLADRDAIDAEFTAADLPALIWDDSEDGHVVTIRRASPSPWDEAREVEQRDWFGRAANQFVNSFRPRIVRITG